MCPKALLGSLLLAVYISPVGDVISKFTVKLQYTDDSQLYFAGCADNIINYLLLIEACKSAVQTGSLRIIFYYSQQNLKSFRLELLYKVVL